MTQNLLFRCLFFFTIVLSSGADVNSQTPFFTEDFSNGIPTNWVRKNLNGSSQAIWTWCSQHLPTSSPFPGCPLVFNDLINKQGPFRANTATNGFAVFDSDYYLFINITTHNSILQTAAIDCSGQPEVWLKFESHIGLFNLPTKDNAVVEISSDSINWTTFNFIDLEPGDLNPGITGWSLNPKYGIIDISSVATNQTKVFIRWRWRGEEEYYWALDDVAIYGEDPSALFIPNNDVRLTEFYAVAPNYSTPISQVEPFGFLADIKNEGLITQTNTTLKVRVENDASGTEVFSEETNVGAIKSDSLIQNIVFPSDGFLATETGSYTTTYEVTSDSMDQRINNNSRSFSFVVSDSTFAKERGILSYTAPSDLAWPLGANKSWGWGNSYYCPKGELYKATSIAFSIHGNLISLAGETLRVGLYQWRDLNDDQECQEEERFLDPTAFVDYEIKGNEPEGEFITVPLNNGLGVPLNDDGEYIAMLEFVAPSDGNTIEIAYNNDLNYGGMFLRSDTVDTQRYGSFLWLGTPGNTTFTSFGFGFGFVPCIRMNISLLTNTHSPLASATNRMDIFPNPAEESIRINIDLEKKTNGAILEIISTDGQQLLRQTLAQGQVWQKNIDLRAISSGIYFVRLTTQEGLLTKRFVKQ